MTIERLFTEAVSLSRMTWGDDSSAEIAGTSFLAHVQQARPEFAQQIGTAWGKTFVFWCPPETDVIEGDSLSVASGSYAGTYSVKNVMKNAQGGNAHLEIVAILDQS